MVVDEQDNILAYKTRAECHASREHLHRSIGVIIQNSQGDMLLQQRSSTKDLFPNYWAVACGGHVSPNEDYIVAAQRELQEELGINHLALHFVAKRIMDFGNEREMDTFFRAIDNGPFSFNTTEVQNVKFFRRDELMRLHDQKALNITPECAFVLQLWREGSFADKGGE